MAQLEQAYDADSLPKSDFEPIPAKKYSSVIHSAKVENVKNNGQQLKVRFDITGPDHQGRVVFKNITLKNASAQAVEIGQKDLGQLIRACGIPRLTDTDQLHGCPVDIRVGIKKSDEYGDQNTVNAMMPPSGANPMPSGLGGGIPKTTTTEVATKGAKPVWVGKQ